MYTIKLTPNFKKWLNGLKDRTTRLRLSRRLERAAYGNLGDVKTVGDGVYEMREFFGPGWRMYYVINGDSIIVMLHGSSKRTQQADIARAIKMADKWKEA